MGSHFRPHKVESPRLHLNHGATDALIYAARSVRRQLSTFTAVVVMPGWLPRRCLSEVIRTMDHLPLLRSEKAGCFFDKEKARLRAGLSCLTNCRGRCNIDADRPAVHHRSSRGRRIHPQGHNRSLGHSPSHSSRCCMRPLLQPHLTRQHLRQRQSHGPLPVQLPLFQPPRRLRGSQHAWGGSLPQLREILFEFQGNYLALLLRPSGSVPVVSVHLAKSGGLRRTGAKYLSRKECPLCGRIGHFG
jgi:hypothetical protein